MIMDVYGQGQQLYKVSGHYSEVSNPAGWKPCPHCGLKPLVWEYDNGRQTGCGCGKNEYDHFSIHAESIMSVVRRSENGASTMGYDRDELRQNWNHWCETGEESFKPNIKRW